MEYFDEHLWPGRIGHLCVVLSFVAALVSFLAYFLATQARSRTDYPLATAGARPGWKQVGVFTALSLAVFALAAVAAAQPGSPWHIAAYDRLISFLAGVTERANAIVAINPEMELQDVLLREMISAKETFAASFGFLSLCLAVVAFFQLVSRPAMYLLDRCRLDPKGQEGWRNLGRFSFLVHGAATLGIIGTLFFILVNKYYEYQYAWANVSDDLPFRYTFSAFWKEQQGSFLLWSFWHIALGLVLMVRAGRWETPVLTVVALAEVVIASMLLGLYFGDTRLGASPFDLLRQVMDDQIFERKDYLTLIKGNGLNPLLQNYWMTIHPPTLFLGFASTIVPFGYAVAGLWLRVHKEWLRPALPWALFSGAILGLGILMGGAWAYEALSFGGYWAWDPVENASLVPWITLLAGIHANLVARSTGYSIRSAYGLYLITFVLILYSTYLTRSGILGETSAHAFTEMGLGVQLLLFILFFTLAGFIPWVGRWSDVPQIMAQQTIKAPARAKNQPPASETAAEAKETISVPVEESGASREFWMFIGALVLLFSAVLITGATSLPVWNLIVKIFLPDYIDAALSDPIAHHNRYQLWIAVFIGLLSGVGQWLRYGERNWAAWTKKFVFHIGIAAVGAGLLTALNLLWLEAHAWQFYLLLFAGMFTLVANADYIVAVIKGNLKLAGSAVSHLGFGLLVLGILGTGLNKRWISSNSFAMEGLIEGADREAMQKNVLLLKEAPMPLRDGFEAIYEQDTVVRQTRSFSVRFKKRDAAGNYTGEEFVLAPNVMYDRQFTKVVASNPSTQHYWHYDLFTHVSSLPKAELDPEYARQQEDSLKFLRYDAAVGDTIFTQKHYLVVEGLTKQPKHPEYHPHPADLAFGLQLSVHALDDPKTYPAEPVMYVRPGEGGFTLPATVSQMQMKIRLTEAALEKIFQTEEALRYTNLTLQEGGETTWNGFKIRFVGVNRDVTHPNYAPESGDIAVNAVLEVTAPDGRQGQARPVYLIRGNQPFSLKDELPEFGLHFNFAGIDPKAGVFTIGAAQATEEQRKIPVEIAENAGRSDYIVLEAIIFPGINLVWAGSLLMLLGLAISLWRRLASR